MCTFNDVNQVIILSQFSLLVAWYNTSCFYEASHVSVVEHYLISYSSMLILTTAHVAIQFLFSSHDLSCFSLSIIIITIIIEEFGQGCRVLAFSLLFDFVLLIMVVAW